MRIGLLPLAAGRKAGGPETYEVELVRSLAALDKRNEYIVYCTAQSAVDALAVTQDNFKFRVLRPSNRFVALSTTLPALTLRDGIDLLHYTYAPPPLSFSPYVFTLHCTSNLAHPEFYDKMKVTRLNALQKTGLKKAVYVMCVSQFIRTYIAENYNIPPERTGVVYNGVGPEFRPLPQKEAADHIRRRFNIDYPYFLYVGKLQARKNVGRLVEAFGRYKQARPSAMRLVLAGPKTEVSEGIDETIAALGLEDSVVKLGYVAPPADGGSPDLPALYSACRLFILPSLYEGFGIPIVEAMACGAPVVTSNVTCLPEVAGGAAHIIDPFSVASIAEALIHLNNDETTRRNLIERGRRRASYFSWSRCAQETLAFYERSVAY